ncbi:PEP-CTERM sorting domain-containing protein [Desulfobacter sp.]|uniref:PEP-CTERM sorting domain-containing protein n=1 Tax=Desulfobacter sp. TaxID=2294 RepID=UPI000E7F32E6|nr:PEP-CTERM sorting domain-containing protein [Desulfobacter sp.]HBT86935.1 hypothetical protein [Desulfobacter sp.]
MMKKLLTLLLSGAMVFILNGVGFGADYIFLEPNDNDIFDLDHESAYSWEINMTGTEIGYDPDKEYITSMVLTFNDIYDNSGDSQNKIYLSVLGSAGEASGKIKDWDGLGSYEADKFVRNGDVDSYNDNQSGYVNYFTSNNDFDNGDVSELYVIESVSTNRYRKEDIEITFTPGTSDGNGTVTIVRTKPNYDGTTTTTTDTVSSLGVENLFAWAEDGIFELGFDPDCHFINSGISLMIYTSDSMGVSHAPEPETLVLFGLGLLGASAFGRKRFS